MLRKLLLTTVAVGGIALSIAPANASLQVFFTDGTNTFACADGGGCDFAGPANRVLTINNTVGNFDVSGTLSVSNTNALTMSNFGVINNGATGTLQMFVSNTGFAGPVTSINEAASLNFLDNVGAGPSTLSFFADAANGQGAPGALGTALFSVNGTPTNVTSSFAGQNTDAFSAAGPFSMTSEIDLNLINGGSVTGFNIGMQAVNGVPEPATWGMMLLGFAAISVVAMRKRGGNSFRLA
jgi:hypothetical protein